MSAHLEEKSSAPVDVYPRVLLCIWIFTVAFVTVCCPVLGTNEVLPSPFLELVSITNVQDSGLNLGIHLSLDRDREDTLFLSDAEQKRILCQAGRDYPRAFELKTQQHIRPYGLVLSDDGSLYIANPDLHEVLVFSPDGELERVIGGFESKIEHPIDLDVMENGLVYVLDDVQKAVLIFDAEGAFKRVVQLPLEVNPPVSFSVTDEELFVLFAGVSQILKVAENGTAHWFGEEGYEIGQLKSPNDLVVIEGSLYVIDRINNAIQIYDLDGHFIREYILYKDLLHAPIAMCIHGDTLYVVNAIDQILEFRMRYAHTGIEHAVLGEEYCALGYYDCAADEFKKALSLGYDPAEVHFFLGLCYYMLNSYAEATGQFQLARNKDPDDIETIFQLANSLYRGGEYAEATKMYETVLIYEPSHVQATYNLGEIYLKLGNLEQAESHFNRALELAPDSTDALLGLGRVYMRRGAFPEALRTFEEVLNKVPRDGRALYYIGLIHFGQGRFEDAAKAFEESARKGPFFIDSLYRLGLSYLSLGQEEEAAAWFQKVLDVVPSHEGARKMLKQIENSN